MATLSQNYLSIIDVVKRAGPNGEGAADILEILNDTSQDILSDFHFMECNKGAEHMHTIRMALPTLAWGALYKGITQSKSEVQNVTDTTGFVEALSTVDTRVLELAGDKESAIRAMESKSFLEAMSQELVKSLFYYDNATDAKHPKGLGARFGALATSGAGNQIVDAGGTGSDNTSIWLATWGDDAVCALYPKGTNAGITQTDKGEQRVLDASGNPYYVKEELIKANLGYSVKDYRKVARVANIDASDLAAGSVDVYKFLRQAYYKLQGRRSMKVADQKATGRTVMYANRDVIEALDAAATNATTGDNFTRLRYMEVEGKEVMAYRNIPIRECDALLNTEARVV